MTTHTGTTRRLAVAVLGLLTCVLTLTATPATAAPPPPLPTCDGVPATIVITVPGLVTPGTGGDDVIVGTSGADTIDAGEGDDLVCGRDGFDTINGGDDDDVLYGGPFNDSLHGDDGADHLFGGDGDDNVFGDAGNDVLRCGASTLDGGIGGPGADSAPPGHGCDFLAL